MNWAAPMRRFAGMLAPFVAAALVTLAARAAERRYLFPTDALVTAEAPRDLVGRTFVAADGVTVRALEMPPPPGARVLVDFHNNRETIEARADAARAYRAAGLGVMLVEYRGYGSKRDSAAAQAPAPAPTEEGLYLDAEAALDDLAKRGIGPERVILCGTSLGSGVAAEMARRGRGARLVLVSPYTSISDLVLGAAPSVPAAALLPDTFDTLAKSRDIHVPTLVIHGDADEVVPFWMGERVSRAVARGRLVRVPGGHHGDLFAREGGRLVEEIVAFAR
jgi:alpha-beta hydrolase superfamily lysophospholipase